jgi:hypothetical protein
MMKQSLFAGKTITVTDPNGNEVQINARDLAHAMEPHHVAALIDSLVNGPYMGRERCAEIGRVLHQSHRTVQSLALRFLLHVIAGFSEQDLRYHTDSRNEAAVKAAKYIVQDMDSGRYGF